MRRRAGNPRELKQVMMTLHFPPQPPSIAADIMSVLHTKFCKKRSRYLIENNRSQERPSKKRSRQVGENKASY
jgi:hypothetical protein